MISVWLRVSNSNMFSLKTGGWGNNETGPSFYLSVYLLCLKSYPFSLSYQIAFIFNLTHYMGDFLTLSGQLSSLILHMRLDHLKMTHFREKNESPDMKVSYLVTHERIFTSDLYA